jgi:uncharacterized damage-inducible protein DinB
MIGCEYMRFMAAYNAWMNARLYAAAGGLSAGELAAERKAFFGSIIGTLNHLVVGDTLWLKRFAQDQSHFPSLDPVRELATPTALGQILFPGLQELFARRTMLDGIILRWADEITEHDLQKVIAYSNIKGVPARKPLASLLVHFFSHQTHHRGQATTLLMQAGEDVGVTDTLALMPDSER